MAYNGRGAGSRAREHHGASVDGRMTLAEAGPAHRARLRADPAAPEGHRLRPAPPDGRSSAPWPSQPVTPGAPEKDSRPAAKPTSRLQAGAAPRHARPGGPGRHTTLDDIYACRHLPRHRIHGRRGHVRVPAGASTTSELTRELERAAAATAARRFAAFRRRLLRRRARPRPWRPAARGNDASSTTTCRDLRRRLLPLPRRACIFRGGPGAWARPFSRPASRARWPRAAFPWPMRARPGPSASSRPSASRADAAEA